MANLVKTPETFNISSDKNHLGLTKPNDAESVKNNGKHKQNIKFTKTQQFWNARNEKRPNPSSTNIKCIWFVYCKVEVTLEVSTRKLDQH